MASPYPSTPPFHPQMPLEQHSVLSQYLAVSRAIHDLAVTVSSGDMPVAETIKASALLDAAAVLVSRSYRTLREGA